MKISFPVIFGLLLLPPTAVHAQLDFTTNDDTITITGYTGPSGVVTIPSETNGYTVTSIADGAFSPFYSGSTGTSSVAIPNTVTSIGDDAFEEDLILTNITMGDSVTNIGAEAFAECVSLTSSITIPNGVTSIESGTFSDCESLKNVTLGTNITSIGGGAFYQSGLTSITIPNSVTDIGDSAFQTCGSLTNVAMSTNIISIEAAAFSGSGLTSITIPSTVTNIGGGAFGGCASLTAITVDTNDLVYSSVDGVLFDKNQTTLIQYPNGKIGNYGLPNSVTDIESGAFSGSGLTSITISSTVTNIGSGACRRQSSLLILLISLDQTSVTCMLARENRFWSD